MITRPISVANTPSLSLFDGMVGDVAVAAASPTFYREARAVDRINGFFEQSEKASRASLRMSLKLQTGEMTQVLGL